MNDIGTDKSKLEEYIKDMLLLMDLDFEENDEEIIMSAIRHPVKNPILYDMFMGLFVFIYKITVKLSKMDERLKKLEPKY